jgi:hypothetical protein
MTQPRPSFETASFAGTRKPLAEDTLSPGIPATPDAGPETADHRGCTTASFNDVSGLLDVCRPQPIHLPLPSAQSPPYDDRPHFDFDFAAALPSTNVSLPTPTIVKTAHNLRLPSFEILGIAAPHPDRFPLSSTYSFSSATVGAGPLSKPDDPLHALSPPLDFHNQADTATVSPTTSPRASRTRADHLISVFTPPSEPGTFNWGAIVNVRTTGMGSPPNSEPGTSPNLKITASATAPGQAPIIVPTSAEQSDAVRMAAWVEDAINTISEPMDAVCGRLS